MFTLLYVVSGSRPVSLLAHFQGTASIALFKTLKRVLRYIKGTIDYKLVYRNESNNILMGYADADWGGDCRDRKSTSGYCFKLFGCTVSWSSKKQLCVALSSTEAEYIALSTAVSEACWLGSLLLDFDLFLVVHPIVIFEDNQSTIKVAKNPENHKRLKHIDIKYHFIRDKVSEGIVKIDYLKTDDQVADMFTKPLCKASLCKFSNQLGLKIEE